MLLVISRGTPVMIYLGRGSKETTKHSSTSKGIQIHNFSNGC